MLHIPNNMKVDKELSKAAANLTKKTDAIIEDVIVWIKKNKTKLIIVICLYLAIKYLFGTPVDEEEDEE